MVLTLLLFPITIVRLDFGIRQCRANTMITAAFARPSVGGAVTEISIAGPSSVSTIPRMRSCAAPGLTRMRAVTPVPFRLGANGPGAEGQTGSFSGMAVHERTGQGAAPLALQIETVSMLTVSETAVKISLALSRRATASANWLRGTRSGALPAVSGGSLDCFKSDMSLNLA